MNCVNGACSPEQAQIRKMDGSGGGQGKGGGMKDIMQSLSAQDQTVMKEQMSTMSMDERMAMMSEMKAIDKATMSDEDYLQSILDILDIENTNNAETEGFSAYA